METLCHPSSIGSASGLDGKRPVAARLAVSALFLMNGVLFASWASRVPALQESLGLSDGALGLALLAMTSGAFLAMPLSGVLIAKIGSRVICRFSLLAYCAALPLLACASDQASFLPALFFFGAAHGMLDISMNAQAVAVERTYARSIMSSFHALWSVGGLVGAVLGGVLAARGVPPLPHFALIGLSLAALAFGVFSSLPDYRAEESTPAQDSHLLPRTRSSRLLLLGIIALCVMVGEGAIADWSALYLKKVVGTGESLAAAGYAVFSFAMVLGRLGGDRLVVAIGPPRLALLSGWLAAGGLLVALVFPNPTTVLVGFACIGAGFSTVVPMVFTAAGNSPGISRGVALSSVSSVGYLGFLLGPPLIGFAAEGLGLRGALGLIVGTSLVVALLARTLSDGNQTSNASDRPENAVATNRVNA